MKLYLDQDTDNKSKIFAAIAVGVYVLLWVVLILFLRFDMSQPVEGEGILISFGDVEMAAANGEMSMSDNRDQFENRNKTSVDETLTQDTEDAPAVKPKVKSKPKDDVKVEKPREVNKKALFPGTAQGSAGKSNGNSEGAGNQGVESGDDSGSHNGTGSGNSGFSFSLSGRSLVGGVPIPQYDVKEEGRLVIEVTVDAQGKVLTATFRSKGSTMQNATLVSAAEAAAKKARFNVDANSPIQSGTITYTFRQKIL